MMSTSLEFGGKAVFTSFTKQAAREARGRVPSKYQSNVRVNTLHSLSYRDLDYKRNYVLTDLTKFAKKIGESIEEQRDRELPKTRIDKIIAFLNTWRNKREEPGTQDLPYGITPHLAVFIINEYRKFKLEDARVDYTDFLTEYIEKGEPLKADHMFVDEAQDLTALQWLVIEKMSRNCQTLSVFGDDDQAIFAFAGSKAQNLLGWDCDKINLLDISHRLPKRVHQLSQDVIEQVNKRHIKDYRHNGSTGEVSLTGTIHFEKDFTGFENYAVLYRNHTMGDWVREEFHRRGVPYQCAKGPYARTDELKAVRDWENWRSGGTILVRDLYNISRYTNMDLKPYSEGSNSTPVKCHCPSSLPWHEVINIRYGPVYKLVYDRYGLDGLIKLPNITLSTIHHAKGGEWEKVLLLTDMAKLSHKQFMDIDGKEDEHRVWYVGTSRAQKHLQLIRPQTVRHYNLLANYPLERLL